MNDEQKTKFENELNEQKSRMLVKIEEEKTKFEEFVRESLKDEKIVVHKDNKIKEKVNLVDIEKVSAWDISIRKFVNIISKTFIKKFLAHMFYFY